MKYCLKCGHIMSDNSMFKDFTECLDCKIPYEDDNVTSQQFESFSEKEKEHYTESLYLTIKSSSVFKEELCNYGTPNFYSSFWFEKYETLTGDVADRTGDDLRQHMQSRYGKESPAYQQAIVQQCIDNARTKKQDNTNIPKCPTCQSTNIRKMSGLESSASIAMFGIFSRKINKTFKCQSCGNTW